MGQRRVQSSHSAPTMETWTLLRWYVTVKQELSSAVMWQLLLHSGITEDPITW